MKVLCFVLIAILIAHLQCSGTCASESLDSQTSSPPTQPPCHEHDKQSDSSQPKSHDAANSCSQGSVIEAKQILKTKPTLLSSAVLHVVLTATGDNPSKAMAPRIDDPPGFSLSLPAASVLRI